MTKHFFSNYMCAHVWAQQKQDTGQGYGSVSFVRTVFYSYSTPIANFVTDAHGVETVLISEERYSPTTGKQLNMVSAAIAEDIPKFTVRYIGVEAGYSPRVDHDELLGLDTHKANLERLIKRYQETCARTKRAKSLWGTVEDCLKRDTAFFAYAEAFGLPKPEIDVAADVAAIEKYHAEREAKQNTPEGIAKREKAAARRLELTRKNFREVAGIFGENWQEGWHENPKFTSEDRAARLMRLATINNDRAAAWRAGANVHLPYTLPTMLRVSRTNVQTSHGASFPVEHAVKAYQLLKLLHNVGKTYQRNGHSIHLGHFVVDSFANGIVRAGCHTVAWEEIENCAKLLGIA